MEGSLLSLVARISGLRIPYGFKAHSSDFAELLLLYEIFLESERRDFEIVDSLLVFRSFLLRGCRHSWTLTKM